MEEAVVCSKPLVDLPTLNKNCDPKNSSEADNPMECDLECVVLSPPSKGDCIVVEETTTPNSVDPKKGTRQKRRACFESSNSRSKNLCSTKLATTDKILKQSNLQTLLDSDAPKKRIRSDIEDNPEPQVSIEQPSLSPNKPDTTAGQCCFKMGDDWIKVDIVDRKVEGETKMIQIKLSDEDLKWVEEESPSIQQYASQESVASCQNQSQNECTNTDNNKACRRKKAVAKVKTTVEKTPETAGSSAVLKSAAKTKEIMSSEEREKKERLIVDELRQLSDLKIYGEFLPFIRPTIDDMLDLEDIKDCDGSIPIKIRQVVSRFLEGRNQSFEEVFQNLQQFIAGAEHEPLKSLDLSRLENLPGLLAEVVNCRPRLKFSETDVGWTLDPSLEIEFIQNLEVKDMADIPEKFRLIVDVHRKLEASVKERMLHLVEMTNELKRGGKGFAKLEKMLISMKDKYAKLEEREKKEREKLEIKLDAERKKIEDLRKKQEESRRKLEEKEEKRKKDEDARQREKKEGDKQKDSTVSKQASFMANFFKKSTSNVGKNGTLGKNGSEDRGSTTKLEENSTVNGSSQFSSNIDVDPVAKFHRNFHPWERPKNAIVAPFPFGPSDPCEYDTLSVSASPENPDLNSWIGHWKQNPRSIKRSERQLRADGTPHPKMKMLQLCMMVPVTRTQLVDVDIDAPKKVIWDIENDPEQNQLQAILNEAEPTAEGLYRWRGKQLQILTEGGGWFDSRRPPYFGTWNKKSTFIRGRAPFARDPELDYDYESDADWESEAGDGEELGSEVDIEDEGDEEADADEDTGFVVPDGYSSDRDIPDSGFSMTAKQDPQKMQKIFFDRYSIPCLFAQEFSCQVLDDIPLVLSEDPNIEFRNDVDFFGEDITNLKVSSLELALYKFYLHPTACSFTYIPACSDSKFAGFLFLKSANAVSNAKPQIGMISGSFKTVPPWKQQATESSETVSVACVENKDGAAAVTDSTGTVSKVAKTAFQVSDELMEVLFKVVHGSKKGKQELADELISGSSGLSRSRAFKIITQFACKKGGRWVLGNEAVAKQPALADLAWKTNVGLNTVVVRPEKAIKPSNQAQILFRAPVQAGMSTMTAPSVAETLKSAPAMPASLDQFGCVPV